MNILELEFEKQLKEQVNEIIHEIEYATSDDFANLTTYMINNNFSDDHINEITEVFNNVLSRIKNNYIKEGE
ncbi:MAG: hypothetical protein ACRC7S_01140 [Cetobacterium sp.]